MASQFAKREPDVGFAHQGFPDQVAVRARAREPDHVGGAHNTALGNHTGVPGGARRESLSHAEIGLKRAQIAVVDADQVRAAGERNLRSASS